MTDKACKWCQQIKPLEAFTKIKRMANGRSNKCEICTNEASRSAVRAYKARNADAIRKQQKDKYYSDINICE